MNAVRVVLLRDLDGFRGETTGEPAARGVSVGEGVLAIGTPSTKKISLRSRGQGGEAERKLGLWNGIGMAGSVADLA